MLTTEPSFLVLKIKPSPEDSGKAGEPQDELLFVTSQAPAILFPGTAWVDPDTPAHLQPKTKAGLPINQLTIETAVLAPLLGAGYALEARRLR